jgi:hypothetical protein
MSDVDVETAVILAVMILGREEAQGSRTRSSAVSLESIETAEMQIWHG